MLCATLVTAQITSSWSMQRGRHRKRASERETDTRDIASEDFKAAWRGIGGIWWDKGTDLLSSHWPKPTVVRGEMSNLSRRGESMPLSHYAVWRQCVGKAVKVR